MFTEDLDAFLDADGLAESATYDGSTAVLVYFDNEYVDPFNVSSTRPMAKGKSTDFADPVGKTLVVGGTSYTIRDRMPLDDGAFVLLKLERA